MSLVPSQPPWTLDEAAEMALPFFLEEREDEDDLALIDFQGQVWPW